MKFEGDEWIREGKGLLVGKVGLGFVVDLSAVHKRVGAGKRKGLLVEDVELAMWCRPVCSRRGREGRNGERCL